MKNRNQKKQSHYCYLVHFLLLVQIASIFLSIKIKCKIKINNNKLQPVDYFLLWQQIKIKQIY